MDERGGASPAGGRLGDDAGRLLVAARDDVEAFARLYALLAPHVVAYFRRRTACPHAASELAAETFVEALAGVARFDPAMGTGRGWLFGIAGNVHKRSLRTRRVGDEGAGRLRGVSPRWHEDDLGRIDALVDGSALRHVVAEALASLPAPTRDAVLMRVVEDRPYAQIAQRLHCTEGTARVRVCRGLGRLGAGVAPSAG